MIYKKPPIFFVGKRPPFEYDANEVAGMVHALSLEHGRIGFERVMDAGPYGEDISLELQFDGLRALLRLGRGIGIITELTQKTTREERESAEELRAHLVARLFKGSDPSKSHITPIEMALRGERRKAYSKLGLPIYVDGFEPATGFK